MFQDVSENRPHFYHIGGARLIIGGTCARPYCLESQVFNTVVYLSGDIMADWRSLLMCAEYVGMISTMAPDPGYVTMYLPWFSYPQAELPQQLTLTNRAHIPRRSYGT